jgi:hypothetical protein
VRPRLFETVILGGLLAGLLDILDAFIVTRLNGGTPTRVLQFIASGVIGNGAFQGGLPAAALGLALHFFIALSAAAAYYAIVRQWSAAVRHPWIAGPVFGVALYFVMNLVVLPLAGFRGGLPSSEAALINGLGIHAFGVGLPIAWFASWSARRAAPAGAQTP